MKRQTTLSLRRVAETDATVLMLAGLVFLLLLLVGGGGMMVMWMWRQGGRAQMMEAEARYAEEMAQVRAKQAMEEERVRKGDLEALRWYSPMAGGLVAAGATNPWNLLPHLFEPPQPEDVVHRN